jgi:predicted nucleic acid-binding protein
LHAGESSAISLAAEVGADWLLIDETKGRRAAGDRNIPFVGTVGVLELAATKHLVDLRDVFDRLNKSDFWISPKLLNERLKLFLSQQDT